MDHNTALALNVAASGRTLMLIVAMFGLLTGEMSFVALSIIALSAGYMGDICLFLGLHKASRVFGGMCLSVATISIGMTIFHILFN